jgi:hypothetical protein
LKRFTATSISGLILPAERPSTTYAETPAFAVKMALFLVALALEIWPATTLGRWWRRRAARRSTRRRPVAC